jgi:serine/threonine-protein kinase
MFHDGQQIGHYTLIRKLGKGGFGEVWLAERKSKFVTTKVAVKLPLDEQVDHEAIKHEATLWEQASGHPNILPIIDADEYDGQIVIVSEYAPDGSLDEWLKTHGIMSVERAIETTVKILDGLEFLHSRNIIHRDLKPANILRQGTTPRLADFGISRALRTTVASQSQNISGTFAYMSPEALDGKRSVQTDVWSVGVNLYQFLTGTLPFPHKEPSVLFPAIIMREFAPLPDSIPQSLKNVIAKALAKLPENRYASAGEIREDLKKVLVNISFPQFVPTEILPEVSLLENITAPVTIENETVTSEAKIAEKLPEEQRQREEAKRKRQAELEQKQREAEILQQDELERQRWQVAEAKRKEDAEDFSEREWLKAASKNEAFDFLNDEAEDIYTLEDGKPLQNEI